jgi:hypothetical protein
VISVARSTAPTQAEKDRGIAQRVDRIKEFWLAGEHDEMTFAVRAASLEALEILFSTQQYGVLGTALVLTENSEYVADLGRKDDVVADLRQKYDVAAQAHCASQPEGRTACLKNHLAGLKAHMGN